MVLDIARPCLVDVDVALRGGLDDVGDPSVEVPRRLQADLARRELPPDAAQLPEHADPRRVELVEQPQLLVVLALHGDALGPHPQRGPYDREESRQADGDGDRRTDRVEAEVAV